MIRKINDWIALNLTIATGTMWCVYLFAAIAMAPLFFPAIEPFCIYISTTILQLILLPLIIVGQSIQNRQTGIRAEEDHQSVIGIVKDIHAMMKEEATFAKDIIEIKTRLKSIEILLSRLP